jgi:hypothetical protein
MSASRRLRVPAALIGAVALIISGSASSSSGSESASSVAEEIKRVRLFWSDVRRRVE